MIESATLWIVAPAAICTVTGDLVASSGVSVNEVSAAGELKSKLHWSALASFDTAI